MTAGQQAELLAQVEELYRQGLAADLAALVGPLSMEELLAEPLLAVRAAAAFWRAGQRARALQLLRALEPVIAVSGDDFMERRRLLELSFLDLDRGCFPEAERDATELLAAARAANAEQLMGLAHSVLGGVAEIRGEHAAALAHIGRAIRYLERVGDLANLCYVHANAALVAAEAGGFETADAHAQRALEYARMEGVEYRIARAEREWAAVLHRRGDHALAEATARRALERFERSGEPTRIAGALLTLARILATVGRLAEARAHLLRGMERLPAEDDPDVVARLNAELSCVEAADGRVVEARTAARRALELFESISEHWQVQRLRARLAELGVALPPEPGSAG